jgi:hypothetical protein
LISINRVRYSQPFSFSEVLTITERQILRRVVDPNNLPDIARAVLDLTAAKQPEETSNENYLGLPDLVRRWPHYTRQGVHKLASHGDFPKPRIVSNGGKTRLWAAAEIEEYERDRDELRDEEAKRKKVVGFLRAKRKGQQASAER